MPFIRAWFLLNAGSNDEIAHKKGRAPDRGPARKPTEAGGHSRTIMATSRVFLVAFYYRGSITAGIKPHINNNLK
jgi:hypothetical protein